MSDDQDNHAHPVNFKMGGFMAAQAEGELDPRNGKPFRQVVLISYAEGRNYAIYLDVPLAEAKQRFEKSMNARSPFEVEDEGWDAVVSVSQISDELFIFGNFGDQASSLSERLMASMRNSDD